MNECRNCKKQEWTTIRWHRFKSGNLHLRGECSYCGWVTHIDETLRNIRKINGPIMEEGEDVEQRKARLKRARKTPKGYRDIFKGI